MSQLLGVSFGLSRVSLVRDIGVPLNATLGENRRAMERRDSGHDFSDIVCVFAAFENMVRNPGSHVVGVSRREKHPVTRLGCPVGPVPRACSVDGDDEGISLPRTAHVSEASLAIEELLIGRIILEEGSSQ